MPVHRLRVRAVFHVSYLKFILIPAMPHTSGKLYFIFECCIERSITFNPALTDRPMEGFLHWGHHERHPGHMAQLIVSEMMGSEDEGSTTKQMKQPAKATHSQP